MPYRIVLLLALAGGLFAANQRLYMKDGGYQTVREYEVIEDRVRYFSTERGEWEEIPLDLVDLDKTRKDAADRERRQADEAKIQDAEDAAIKAERQEIASVPMNAGPYYIDNGKLVPLKPAEVAISNSKTRKILQVLAPAPIVPGKSTVEAEGEAASFRLNAAPEFYFRLEQEERFAIFKLEPKKNLRIVQTVNIIPQSEEMVAEQKIVPTFKKQLAPRLYKIWPEQPLEPGEYALVEYTEGEMNIQVWDFGVGPGKK